MTARRTTATLIAAVMAAVAFAAPANAATINGSCNSPRGDNLNALAQYTVGGDGWRTWYRFAARPYGPGNGNSNNVNFYFYQDGAQHWTNFSPDNVANGSWYSANANIHMPPWSTQEVQWEGIFDHKWADDPNCSAFGSA